MIAAARSGQDATSAHAGPPQQLVAGQAQLNRSNGVVKVQSAQLAQTCSYMALAALPSFSLVRMRIQQDMLTLLNVAWLEFEAELMCVMGFCRCSAGKVLVNMAGTAASLLPPMQPFGGDINFYKSVTSMRCGMAFAVHCSLGVDTHSECAAIWLLHGCRAVFDFAHMLGVAHQHPLWNSEGSRHAVHCIQFHMHEWARTPGGSAGA